MKFNVFIHNFSKAKINVFYIFACNVKIQQITIKRKSSQYRPYNIICSI